MTDFLSQPLTIPAGETRILQGGGYFRLHESGAPLFVVFKTHDGANLAQGVFEEGEWARFEFGQVSIHNPEAFAVNCKIRISKFESGSDQMAGALTVTGDVLAPVPVSSGINPNYIGGSRPQFIASGNRSAVFFDPSVGLSYGITELELYCDAPVAVGLIATAPAVVTAEGVWGVGMTLSGVPFAAPVLTLRELSNVAPGVSALADAAAVVPSVGVFGAGHHVVNLRSAFYLPAGHALGFGLVFSAVSGFGTDVVYSANGVKV